MVPSYTPTNAPSKPLPVTLLPYQRTLLAFFARGQPGDKVVFHRGRLAWRSEVMRLCVALPAGPLRGLRANVMILDDASYVTPAPQTP